MNLLQAYVHRCHELDLFSQKRTQVRAARLLLCNLLCLGRKWITRIICMANRDQCDWSADYKLFSRSPWRSQDLFTPVVRNSLDYFDPAEPIIIAGDETKCKRAGNKVKRSRWVRDPLSPPFHVNFRKGIRFVMSFKVIRATASELEVQMVGGAHPTRCVARRSNTPGILASRALRDGCLDHLGASLYLCPRPLSRRLEPGCWRSVCSWFPSVSGSESGSGSIPIPIPTPTPIMIPTAIGTRLSCIEKMSKPQGWASPTTGVWTFSQYGERCRPAIGPHAQAP
jgi:hypothetical protein